MVEHPQHRQHAQRQRKARHEAEARQRTQRTRRFGGRRVDHHIEVGNGPDMAVQDDGDAADHGVTNAVLFEPVEDIAESLWSCAVHRCSIFIRSTAIGAGSGPDLVRRNTGW